MLAKVKPGDIINAVEPAGRFTITNYTGKKNVILFAAGSGVAVHPVVALGGEEQIARPVAPQVRRGGFKQSFGKVEALDVRLPVAAPRAKRSVREPAVARCQPGAARFNVGPGTIRTCARKGARARLTRA